MISKYFEVLENIHKIGTSCIWFFKDYLIVDTNWDEEFYVGALSTFGTKVMSLIDEARKKQYLPSSPKISQIKVGWKGRIEIMKYMKEKCASMEDKKSATFFKI